MTRTLRRWLGATLLLTLAAGTILVLRGGGSGTEKAAATSSPLPKPLPPAANLRIPVVTVSEPAEGLLDPAAKAWTRARPVAVLLNRTPRIYQTESPTDRPPPACRVSALRNGTQLYLLLQWEDRTRDAPQAAPKQGTENTSAFPDAAAVMVPQKWIGLSFPSLQMGDKANPVRLYYWNASRGAEELSASGRATPLASGRTFPCRARHDGSKWLVTLALSHPGEGYPLAFAVWDGHQGDRDGLKFFSVWYVLCSLGEGRK